MDFDFPFSYPSCSLMNTVYLIKIFDLSLWQESNYGVVKTQKEAEKLCRQIEENLSIKTTYIEILVLKID